MAIEHRPKPIDELEQRESEPAPLPGHLLEHLVPGPPNSIQPIAESSMAPGRMSEFVRQDGFEFIRRKPLHQRQAEQQVIPVPAKNAQPRNLNDCSIIITDEQHLV